MTIELSDDLSGWPAEKTVFHVDRVRMRIMTGDHPFHLAEREAIAENWRQEVAANPALFDGRMILQRRIGLIREGIVSEGYVVPFSTFLWWRKLPERHGALHIHAYPVLETSDRALVAIQMGAHTANAGMVYFACGSFDPDDVVDGHCDPELNMRREVLEETGIELHDAIVSDGYHIAHFRRTVTLFRLFRFDQTADQMIARIERHMQVAEDKEIAGAVAIRSADPSAHPYHVGMLPVLNWYFGQGQVVAE